MEEEDVLLNYIKQGLARGNTINDLKINAIQKGYSPKKFDSALIKSHESGKVEKIEPKKTEKKTITKHIFGIPSSFIFPLTWTIVFIIIGITVQSLISKSFVFAPFFTSNFLNWLQKFNFFSDTIKYGSLTELLRVFIKEAYYFAIVGGLFSLLWVFVAWILSKLKKEDQKI